MPARQRKPATSPGLDAVTAMRAAEFKETPFGGYAGAMAAHVPATQAPHAPEPFTIPPADWSSELAGESGGEQGPQLRPVEAMLVAEQDEPPPPPGPPVVDPPLQRPAIPPVDWREVEAEGDAERIEADRVRREAQSLDNYPAQKAGRKTARSTPNLDKARQIQAEIAEQLGRVQS
jgi:hypothetical protein